MTDENVREFPPTLSSMLNAAARIAETARPHVATYEESERALFDHLVGAIVAALVDVVPVEPAELDVRLAFVKSIVLLRRELFLPPLPGF
jgi:hypothetical protein